MVECDSVIRLSLRTENLFNFDMVETTFGMCELTYTFNIAYV